VPHAPFPTYHDISASQIILSFVVRINLGISAFPYLYIESIWFFTGQVLIFGVNSAREETVTIDGGFTLKHGLIVSDRLPPEQFPIPQRLIALPSTGIRN
jgi:hypothetical protein